MRWHLLKTFDEIYVLDLHGDTKEGIPGDENVFDIQQGVSISLFVKTNKKAETELGKIYHTEIRGNRELKYESLLKMQWEPSLYNELSPNKPYYFFVPKNEEGKEVYEKGFAINDLSINTYSLCILFKNFFNSLFKEILHISLQCFIRIFNIFCNKVINIFYIMF